MITYNIIHSSMYDDSDKIIEGFIYHGVVIIEQQIGV